MNMPFELGLDHACRRFGAFPQDTKAILVLEHARYDYQKALSDISGWDMNAHHGDYKKAVRHVRSWLVAQAGAPTVGAAKILGKYLEFQEWYWKREEEAGSSPEDIREYPTAELIRAMHSWKEDGEPV
jgi:hypothetical protein